MTPFSIKPAPAPGWVFVSMTKSQAAPFLGIPGFGWSSEAKAFKMGIDLAATYFDYEFPEDTSHIRDTIRPLKPHQLGGANRTHVRKRHVLAYEMGCGKTASAIQALAIDFKVNGPRPTLIVCPAGVRLTWVKEIEKWWPGWPEYETVTPGKFFTHNPAAMLTICSFEGLPKIYHTPTHVVVDEAQYIKTEQAQRTQRLDKILRAQPRDGLRVFLTGTPVDCKVADLWSIVDLLYPGVWGKFPAFVQYYSNLIPDKYAYSGFKYEGIRADRAEELYARFSHLSSQTTLADVAASLPPPDVQNVFISQKDTRSLPEIIETTFANMPSRHQMILTHRVATAEQLAHATNADCVIAGGNKSEKKRYEILEALSNKPSARVVATFHSLKTGISLPKFQSVFYAELYPNPSTIIQSQARYIRMDSPPDSPTRIRYGIREGSVDEAISLVVRKRLQDRAMVVAPTGADEFTEEAMKLAERRIQDYLQTAETDEYLGG